MSEEEEMEMEEEEEGEAAEAEAEAETEPEPEAEAETEPEPEAAEEPPAGAAPPPPPEAKPDQERPVKASKSETTEDGDDENDMDDVDQEDGERKGSHKVRIAGDSNSGKETSKETKKRKHSISAHLQAELNKQKILRAKQERENRRSELDTQHLFLIETVGAHLDLKPKDVEEFVIDSADFMDIMNSFFERKGKKACIFVYQDADPPGPESGRPLLTHQGPAKKEKMKRILITDGHDIPLKGVCMYFMRISNDHKISIKNIAEEVYFGILDIADINKPGVVLASVHDTLENIHLKNLKTNTSWIKISDPETAAQVRLRFLTSIDHYSDFLKESRIDIESRLDLREISDLDEVSETYLKTSEDVIEAAKNPDIVAKVEHTVIVWCKNFEKVLAMSKQMRKENDSMGPLAELAYWRNLMAKMCYIIQQVQQWSVVNFIQVLIHSKSRVLKRWRDVDSRVTDEFHEAKDNVRFMYALEKFCTPLYQTDPPRMIEHINSMMYVIRTIHTTSRYYNTCEKVTALMVKISNQMVAACRRYLTKDGTTTVWDQDKQTMLEKLNKCIELYETYRGSYEATKADLADNPDGKRFNLSVNNIFGRFEQFCDRLKKIIQVVEIFNLYNPVHESHIDGLEDISARLKNLHRNILEKTYDPLDFRKPHFDVDFVAIRSAIDDIQRNLEAFMDKAIENCPTCMHGLLLLERFKNLQNRCLDIDGKNWYLFQFYHNEIELLLQIYEGEKNETPIPRGYPPFAGKIAWARHLYKRLERPMKWFQEKTQILKREDARATIKLFNSTCKKLIFYEMLVHESWMKTCDNIYDALEAPILTLRGTVRQELVLNFDPFFRQIIEETEIIQKLNLEVPDIAQIVYYKQDSIFDTYERIKDLLDRFLTTKVQVPQDLSVLMRPILKKAEKSFMPGVTNINWTSLKSSEYFDYIESHQNELEDIVKKVHQIITVRINQYLYDVSHTLMIDFPEDRPMSAHEYMDRIRNYGVIVSKELEYKSRMCEQAVIELINLLLKTCEMPTPVEKPLIWLFATAPLPTFKDENVVEKPPVDPSILPAQITKEEQIHIYEECRNVFAFYNQKCIEALQKTTRISLDILRQRTEEPQVSKRNPGKILNRVPLFTVDLTLSIPTIQLKPMLNDMQMVLNRSINLITEVLKRVVIWGQSRRTSFDQKSNDPFYKDPTKGDEVAVAPYERLKAADALLHTSMPNMDKTNARLKNSFKPVMDYKDISKMVLMMQTVVLQAKQTCQNIIAQYGHYSFLWKDTRDEEVKAIIDEDPVITEVESIIWGYHELEAEIEAITVSHRVGPLEVLTREMKMGFLMEVKEWKLAVCRHMSNKYKIRAVEISKFMDEANKDLALPIKDMNDIRFVMTVLEKIRDKSVDYDLEIPSIEECYAFLTAQKFRVPEEESNRVDTMRYNFRKLQARGFEVQEDICRVQEVNRKKLLEAVAKFKSDLQKYVEKYTKNGPMVEGLAAQNASDRLVIFQDEFDELYERYTMFNAAEKLFGYTPTEYPELMKLKRELALLQKLYGLYNDVMRSVNGYFDIKWSDLNIPKINVQLQEFQNRCRKLPKALKGWPAFEQLKKKIDDFNATCPLLERMTNKAMKDRHWERIGDVTGHSFQIEDENFSLKHVMAAPLLQFKDEVEDICIGAVEEKDMEAKLKQLQMDWSVEPMLFAHFKNRGELLLREVETLQIMAHLKESLGMVNAMLANRYSAFYKRDLQAKQSDFSRTLEILETWLFVMNLWVDMEAVFVGGDVARQMPLEAKRFNNSNRSWVKIMQRARESPLVISCCVGDDFMTQILPTLKEQLQLCEAAVNEFMEAQALAEAAAAQPAQTA